MLLQLLITTYLFLSINPFPIFHPYPLANDYFDIIYKVQLNSERNMFLNIACKEKDMLSIILTRQLNQSQAPRFDIYGGMSKPRLATDAYALLHQCHFKAVVGNQGNLIEIFRVDVGKPVIKIKDIIFHQEAFTFTLIDQSIKWGLGQRFQHNFHITDGKWTIWNRDKPWKIDTGNTGNSQQTYGHQPVYLARNIPSKRYHLMYLRNTFGMLYHSTDNSNTLTFNVLGGNLQLMLLLGRKDPQPVLKKYHKYIGAAHIPPFWSLGFHQCRWGYHNLDKLQQVIINYNKHSLPLDAIWTDLDYMDRKMIFTINQHLFPTNRFNNMLQQQSLHYVPIIDVGVSVMDQPAMEMGKQMNVFIKALNGQSYYTGEVWPGTVHFVDYLHPNASQFWQAQLARLYQKIHFSGVWLDMNEPSNFRGNEGTASEQILIQQRQGINMMTINIDLEHYSPHFDDLRHKQVHAYYGHLSTIPTYKFLEHHGRPFIISRSNSVGSGKFAGHWTGDNVASWAFLRLSISGNFLYQIFGVQMVGADICGFHDDTTEQLCSRWMQVGSLYPFPRNHNEDRFRDQQPYAFGTQLLHTSELSLKMRYALLKQLYTILVSTKGCGSFYRPIFFEFYDDQDAYKSNFCQTELLIGSYLLSAPIVEKGQIQREVYFPSKNQTWYSLILDKDSGTAILPSVQYRGGQKHIIENKLPSAPPLFLRGGYLLLSNVPQTRTKHLNNKFHIISALVNGTAKGQILGITDYHNQNQLKTCLNQSCLLRISLTMKSTLQIELNWSYDSNKYQFGGIDILSISLLGLSLRSSQAIHLSEPSGNRIITLQSVG